jgi:pilus assembly protein Flp/PilA
MLSLYTRLMSWLNREEGQGMAEYGLIIALVAIVVIVALTTLGTQLSTIFVSISSAVGGT